MIDNFNLLINNRALPLFRSRMFETQKSNAQIQSAVWGLNN
jgi:hypothetical protein